MTNWYMRASCSVKILVTVVSTLFLYLLLTWIAGSSYWALVIVISLLFHEFGHYVAFRYYGLQSAIMLVPPFGAFTRAYDVESFDDYPLMQWLVISLAGPAANLMLMCMGLYFMMNETAHEDGMVFAAVSATLAGFNLLPLGGLDGHKAMHCIFASASTHLRRKTANALFCMSGVIAPSAILVRGFSLETLPVMALVFCYLVWRSSNKIEFISDPSRVMSQRQVVVTGTVYGAMIGSALLVGSLVVLKPT